MGNSKDIPVNANLPIGGLKDCNNAIPENCVTRTPNGNPRMKRAV
jgi:hypothetical protein